MKYFVYWTEDRRDNEKKPSIWNCIITNNATEDDLETFQNYNEFISNLTNNKIIVGWIENEANDSVDQFVKDQNYYNDLVDDWIPNIFTKYEYDHASFENLKIGINGIIDFYNGIDPGIKDEFLKGVYNNLCDNFFNKNKAFIQFKDMKLFIESYNNKVHSKTKKKK